MKLFLPYHLGSGNRGCEGITRGILEIFGLEPHEVVLYSCSAYDFESDKKLGIDKIGDLRFGGGLVHQIVRFACLVLKKFNFPQAFNSFISSYYLRDVKKGDFVFITGGDIYCYEGEYKLPNLITRKANKKGAKTVLYGVSFEENFLTEEVVAGLKLFDTIFARESLSSKTLTKLGLKNYLFPDPAFALHPEHCELPDCFSKGDVVGINISPYTNNSPLFKENIMNLVEYIQSRNMAVCFIPHVFWKRQDDRVAVNEFRERMGSGAFILDSENLSYLQIRHVISKCRYFIGGRTHSVISAYSAHVPCIALGYSIKARGIANDINMPGYTLVDSKNITTTGDLLSAFKTLEQNENEVLAVYDQLEQYANKAFETKKLVEGSTLE